MYIVAQEGVYRHDIYGVFDTLEKAKSVANSIASADTDDYHSYDVLEFELNTVNYNDGKTVYSVRKGQPCE